MPAYTLTQDGMLAHAALCVDSCEMYLEAGELLTAACELTAALSALRIALRIGAYRG